MSILIKNGRIITAVDDYIADIYIEGESVKQIGRDLNVTADRVFDASGKLVIPGGIDPHTHMDMPFGGTTSADDFHTGTLAAAHGGTTTIVDFAIQQKGQSTLDGLEVWHQKAEGKAVVDYAFHMIVTDMPVSRLGEMEKLAEAGVTSYKLFMAYPGVLYVDDGTLYRTFRQAGLNNTRICMHAENGIVIDEIIREAVDAGHKEPSWHAKTRPTRMEAEGVHRAVAIAEVAKVPLYIVHLSSHDALEQVKIGRARGVDVQAETCPQYLFFDQSWYDKPNFEGAKWVMTPALREKWNQGSLWQGLRMGDLSAVATDHCPFCFTGQKELGRDSFTKIPNGAPGVENRVTALYDGGVRTGQISLNRWVELTSTSAAKTFGLFPRKGTIAVGSDADIVIFDPDETRVVSVNDPRTHHMRVDYSAYEGHTMTGWSETVLSRGRVIVHKSSAETDKGGRFVKRARVGELLR
ncbi:MAG: dihydropyrimidinase [Deltaproteobacteria bacterium]|nr:dihydropyrimidinase [Deltaproteobacteria bacterium]